MYICIHVFIYLFPPPTPATGVIVPRVKNTCVKL